MANLNKLLVHVPSNLCDVFKTKYVNGTDRSYDNKVVFLEKTQEIFTQGKLYGTNIEDFSALKELVGTIPTGATSTNIVAYISEMTIKSVKKKDKENLIGVDTDETSKNVTIYSTQDLKDAADKAKTAIQSVKVLGKTLNNTTTSISVEEAKSYLDIKSAASKESSYFATPSYVETTYNNVIGKNTDTKTAYTIYGTRAYASYVASEAAQGVVDILPVVTNGSGIRVTSNTDSNGKTTYTVSTSAEVWHYKGNKTTKEQLPASDNTTGDVWSVGPVDAAGSTLYAWDGDEWINIGSADGVTGVDTTLSSGVKLDQNTNGTVQVIVTPGSIANGNGSVITGGTAYTAIFEAKKACNSYCNSYVNAYVGKLQKSYTSKNGAYVKVKVDTKGGNVSYVGVTETDTLKTAVTNANSAVQTIPDSTYLSATKTGTTVNLNLDETKVFNYVSNNIWETYSA